MPWYHLAGVSDGATLKLHVDKVLVATTNLTVSGSPNTALAKGTVNGTDWKTGAWAVGRGLYAGGHTDRAYGFIDEVRISNTALHPGQFLATQKPQITFFAIAGSSAPIQLDSGLPGTACRLWQSLTRRPIRLDPGRDRCVRQSGALHLYASLQHRKPQALLPGRGRSPGSSRGSPHLAIGGRLGERARRYPGADRFMPCRERWPSTTGMAPSGSTLP